MRVDSKCFGSTRLVKLKTRQDNGHAIMRFLRSRNKSGNYYIYEDENNGVVLMSVESTDSRSYVELLFWLTLLIFGDVSRCSAWVLGKDTAR